MSEKVLPEYSLADFLSLIKTNFRYALANWLRISLAFVVSAAAGVAYTFLLKPNYVASTTFVSETNNNDRLGGYSSLAAQFGFDIGQSGGDGAFEGENLTEVLRSRNLVVTTLLTPIKSGDSSKLLIDEYLSNHKLNSRNKNVDFQKVLRNGPNYSRAEDSILTKVYLTIIKDKLVVEKKDKKLNFMVIEFSDINELFAIKFSNCLVENAIQFYTKYKTLKLEKNIGILEKQADSVRRVLYGSINNVANSVDLNINPSKQILKTTTQKANINLTISQVVLPEILKQLEVSKISLRKETPLIQIVDAPVLPLKNTSKSKSLVVAIIALLGTILYTFIILLQRKENIANSL